MPLAKALYVAPLAGNTLFADDFENYSQGQNLGSGSTGASPTTGWGFYDSDTGGQRTINNTNYYSCCKALWMLSPSIASGKFDTHKMFAATNSTVLVTISAWFSFTNTFKTDDNLMTFTLEMFDGVFKYECGVFIHPTFLFFNSDDGLPNILNKLSAYDDSNSVYGKGAWHHFTITCNIRNFTYVSASIDNMDYTAGIVGHKDKSLGDIEQAGFAIHTLRFETALVNASPHTTGYWKWVDDVIITDTSPGQPNIIQFALRGAAWGLASMFSVIALVIGFMWIKMDLEGKGYTHGGLEYKKKILRGGIMIALAIAIIWGATAIFTG